MARGFIRSFRLDDAKAVTQEWLAKQPDNSEAHLLHGSVLELREQFGEAIDSFRKALELDRERGEARLRLAVLLVQRGRGVEAQPHLEYLHRKQPDDPIVVHMMKAACKPGHPAREQHKLGRIQLYSTTFETYERNIRDQLGRMLGGAGFDPAKDIEGITVNRWAHGYAFTPNPLFDPDWKEEEKPWVIGRKPFGKISFFRCF